MEDRRNTQVMNRAALTKRVVDQYAQYEPLPGKKVNGDLTLGENIADLAGVTIAYDAYKMSLGGKAAKKMDGYTGDQRFFLAWAQVWRSTQREENYRNRLRTDSHSPEEYRVNGVVRNLDEWYKAFNVKQGEKMYLSPEERIKLW